MFKYEDNLKKERASKPLTKKQREKRNGYTAKYRKKTYKEFCIKIRKDRHADLLEHLSKQESLVNYLIQLVYEDMNRQ